MGEAISFFLYVDLRFMRIFVFWGLGEAISVFLYVDWHFSSFSVWDDGIWGFQWFCRDLDGLGGFLGGIAGSWRGLDWW